MKKLPSLLALSWLLTSALRAELIIPAIIGDHMVLQQKQSDPIWGWDTPGTKIAVTFAGQNYSTTAGADGKWTVKLAPLPANATPQTLTVSGSTRREIRDVLIGEVWMCSGQSNMQLQLAFERNGDLETAEAELPNLRLITVPKLGTQELQNDFKGQWQASTPETVRGFSAVGFLFGRYLGEVLKVPVGLINNSWGASQAEAWVRRSALQSDPRFKALMDATLKREAELKSEKGQAAFAKAMAEWKSASEKAKAEGKTPPRPPTQWLTGQYFAGNVFAGVLHPTIGFGIKGVIWYQGESNAVGAYQYASLFPFLIEQWRKEWGQGDFPFYWVQLANYQSAYHLPAGDSFWAELREAQTKAMRLPNTGQAVTIDLGEGSDIHPKNKHDVAARLVRWPLVKDYGLNLPYHSPEFKSLTIASNKALVAFDCFGSGLRPFGVPEARGFTLCGADKVWHLAKGTMVGTNEVEVCSSEVPSPIAVRYAWADNPVCNLYSSDGLPVTPFRTDNFKMTTEPKAPPTPSPTHKE